MLRISVACNFVEIIAPFGMLKTVCIFLYRILLTVWIANLCRTDFGIICAISITQTGLMHCKSELSYWWKVLLVSWREYFDVLEVKLYSVILSGFGSLFFNDCTINVIKLSLNFQSNRWKIWFYTAKLTKGCTWIAVWQLLVSFEEFGVQ